MSCIHLIDVNSSRCMFNTWNAILVHVINCLLLPIVGWKQVCVLSTLLCKPETSTGRTGELWVSHTLVSLCSTLLLYSAFHSSNITSFPQHPPQKNEWLSETPGGTGNGGKTNSSVSSLCSHAGDHKAASADERDSETGTKWPSKSWAHEVLSQSSRKGPRIQSKTVHISNLMLGELGVQFYCMVYPSGPLGCWFVQ